MTFTIRCSRETGTITYHCPTRSSALDKVRDFRDADYADVTISENDCAPAPRSRVITLLDLDEPLDSDPRRVLA